MSEEQRANALLPTNEDTCGPYFPIYFADDTLEDLTRIHPGVVAGASGQHIILRGRVLDRHGSLAHGVVMEFWQANAKGVYRTPETEGHPDIDPWFHGYGRLCSRGGDYSFRTIMPGPGPGRAPNITVTLFSDGINRIVTQIFFAGHPANEGDPLLQELDPEDRARLMARRHGTAADGAEIYRLDIVMAGENETPFFDDIES
jgi:protocatechuate 3,4-dioxygenase beta subunit